MAARTIEDQVAALLSRSVAADKQGGSPQPGLEASAVFDSIALNLILKPRGGLYFAYLARNALLRVVREELALFDSLAADITDLGNPAYKISGASNLRRAQVALLNMESLPRINSTSTTLTLFNSAVGEFLNKHLAANVRRVGKSELVRPASEAEQDLPETVAQLQEKHADMLDRLYTLATGIENFDAAPFGALIGTTTVSRARADLEEIISIVEAGGDPTQARDVAVRLLASRATINTIATPPKWGDTLLPAGTTGKSDLSKAKLTGAASHPFLFPASNTIAVETGGGPPASFSFLPGNAAMLCSRSTGYPVTVPANYYLFLTYSDGLGPTSVRIPLGGTYSNSQGVADKIAEAAVPNLSAIQFANDPSRLVIFMPGATKLAVNPIYVMTEAESQAAGVTTGVFVTYSTSAASYIGLKNGDVGTQEVLADVVVDALNSLFGDAIEASSTNDGKIQVSTLSEGAGVSLRVFGDAAEVLGLPSEPANAVSTVARLDGVADHTLLLQPGDLLLLPDGKTEASIQAVFSDCVILPETKTFSGSVSARSVLVATYATFHKALTSFLRFWESTPYVTDLSILDRSLAPLLASRAPAQRGEALAAVEEIKTDLTRLLNVLSDASTMLPDHSAQAERRMVDGILTTLAERSYERAADLLLKGDLQALLEMDDSTASYGGNFLKATSDFVRSSVIPTGSGVDDAPKSVSMRNS
jgi:hypothetical protein